MSEGAEKTSNTPPFVVIVPRGDQYCPTLERAGQPRVTHRPRARLHGEWRPTSVSSIGSGLGSAGFIVYDDTADMVAVARMFARFLHVESCGQCGACKLHSGAISETPALVEQGTAEDRDIEDLGAGLRMVTTRTPATSRSSSKPSSPASCERSPEDFVTHLEGTPTPSRLHRLPKIVDMADDTVTYDANIALKQPDWTNSDERRAG